MKSYTIKMNQVTAQNLVYCLEARYEKLAHKERDSDEMAEMKGIESILYQLGISK